MPGDDLHLQACRLLKGFAKRGLAAETTLDIRLLEAGVALFQSGIDFALNVASEFISLFSLPPEAIDNFG